MARLTNEEIRNMSINEAATYTDLHPAEAWRFAKIHGDSALEQTKKAVKHGVKNKIFSPNPKTLKLSKLFKHAKNHS